MATRILRSDAPAIAQVTRLTAPEGSGEISLTVLGSGKYLTFSEWDATAIVVAWNNSAWPEFAEARASANGTDVLLTSKTAGRPFYVAATVRGTSFGNEIQALIPVNVSGGSAIGEWFGQETAEFDPLTTDAADLKTLFEALPGGIVASNELTWTGPNGGPWTVSFGGRYAEQNVPPIEIHSVDLTGGLSAQNEKQKLVLNDPVPAVAFQLRRSDTLQTSSTLSTLPITHADVQAALAEIGYTTTCTGGPLSGSGSSVEQEMNYFAGIYHGSTLRSFNTNGDGMGPIGNVSGELSVGLLQFASTLAQGTVITSAVLKPLFVNGYDPIPGVVVKAEASDNAAWPANAAAASAAALTTASTTFNITSGGPYTIDVTGIVQELFNRPGWADGHKMLFHFIPPPTTHTAQMLLTAGGANPLVRIYLEITVDGEVITIEWTGSDATKDIPLLLVVPTGLYTNAPHIIPVQDGHPAQDAAVIVETIQQGGEAIVIRDDVRSRGPNHYDDPLNWNCDDGTFWVPEDTDNAYADSGRVDLLYGLNQRSGFIAIPTLNQLRLTDVHHFWVGQAVRLVTTNTLPGGLAVATTYYIATIDGPYVRLSATRGGAPVTVTTVGTGVHTMGVKLAYLETQSRWTGKLGLPRNNAIGTSYFEYRERSLTIWCDKIKVGTGDGGGSSRINLDTGTLPTSLQAINSGGSIESGVNAVLWKGSNAANEVEALGADLGIAIFPEETTVCDVIKQRGGTLTLGRGVDAAALDATSGSRKILGARIAGDIISN